MRTTGPRHHAPRELELLSAGGCLTSQPRYDRSRGPDERESDVEPCGRDSVSVPRQSFTGEPGAAVQPPGWLSTPKGQHLRGRRAQDTKPELALRRALHALGLRFRLQRRLAPGCRPDVIFIAGRVAIFVDGCFWHGCPQHGRKTPFKGPNATLWEEKMSRNRERDARASVLASTQGYRVLRLWECEINRDRGASAALRVSALLRPPSGPASATQE
ncbi:very short patch repair endonuclease [Motilibacter peucedani]|uniref:very short patch repair endonuclease n=1 Tax=Motilibacter peucedani TaxID=598650 RepID=UPI0038B26826